MSQSWISVSQITDKKNFFKNVAIKDKIIFYLFKHSKLIQNTEKTRLYLLFYEA